MSIIITAVCILILFIPNKRIYAAISGGSEYTLATKYLFGSIQRFFGFGICLIFIIKMGYGKALNFGTSSGWKVILFIWPAIILCITNLPYDLILSGKYQVDTPLIFPMIMHYTSVGLFEEIFFRGAILSILLTAWGSTKRGLYRAVIVSSIFFGMLHLLNLVKMINGADILVETIGQIFYTTFLGILFAAIYLRTQNIWISIICHTSFDIASGLYDIRIKTGKSAATAIASAPSTIMDNVENVLYILPLAIFGLFILRKVKYRSIGVMN